jgi:hypothetical protein
MAAELNVPLNYFFCDDQTTAELALLISRMTEEERSNLIEALKKFSRRKHADKNDVTHKAAELLEDKESVALH